MIRPAQGICFAIASNTAKSLRLVDPRWQNPAQLYRCRRSKCAATSRVIRFYNLPLETGVLCIGGEGQPGKKRRPAGG